VNIGTAGTNISASHNLNYQYCSVRAFITSTGEMVLIEPNYSLSTPNIMVFTPLSSNPLAVTLIIES
jgi:hypothetical protein